MTRKIANDNNSSNKEQIYNTLDDNTIIGIGDDLNKLKTEVIALKMFVIDQLYLLKQSVSSTKTPEYNNNSDFYINSLSNNQTNRLSYRREQNKKFYYPVFIIPKSI